ncbi:MAG TPA: aminoglycoside phosphotransferase family protein [Lachnospiraceae bacterium]|nr:aminoglycoside phosphotransferase family protein [Lachnospiraceae bacterium]
MSSEQFMEKIGSGATAEVYLYDENRIVKVFHEDKDEGGIEEEFICSRAVEGVGINVPRFIERTVINGRKAIIQEYICGKSLLEEMMQPDLDMETLVNEFAKLHHDIHTCREVPLESVKTKLARKIGWSNELDSEVIRKVYALLDSLPEGNALLHNDFHPGNVIHNDKGYYTIDWCDASCGNPIADVARTSLVYDCVSLPDGIPQEIADSINQTRKMFGTMYESAYAKLTDENMDMLKKWKVVVAAARMFCEDKVNIPIFRKMIEEYFEENCMLIE